MTSNVTPFRNLKHVSILWASPDRAEEIAALHAKVFVPPWDAASIRGLLEHPAATSLVAVAGDPKAAIGFVIGQLAADEAEILSIGVSPNWQRAGLGTLLVEGLARAARRGEAKRLFLDVAADNVAALALYRRLSFEQIGVRKDYYRRASAQAVDAITLVLPL